jgi:hypothetical protein
MTTERAFVVGVERTPEVSALVDDIRSAAERARKADPGDRSDVIRFESLAAQLEHLAATSESAPRVEVSAETASRSLVLGIEESQWTDGTTGDVREAALALVRQGRVPVVVLDPLAPGSAPQSGGPRIEVPPPADSWQDPTGATGRKAVEARFRAQIGEALEASARGGIPRAIAPSGVQHSVVTEILRDFVATAPGGGRVDAPIEYRDGSRSAHPIALRSLDLRSQLSGAELDLHFALLSIRHAEMDAVVHGAWLRNAEVSRPRPAAQTDDMVYDISRTQFLELTSGGARRVRIHLYQTGLETAVVGFYKALVDHLLEFERTVAVQPMFFQSAPRRRDGGKPRNGGSVGHQQARNQRGVDRRGPRDGATPVEVQFAKFRKGTPWQM